MDSIDYRIIRLLQKNGRLSMKKLGELVSLTPPAVAERVKKLEETGVICGYRAVINPEKLGKIIKAVVNISMKPEKRNEFLKLVAENPNIVECHHVTGSYSMTIKAIFKETVELESLIGKLQQFGHTETLIILSSPLEYKPI
ncbi:Lrp/AsnC family transcriptional regulator [Petroclostridium sp. X23]|jgi:Lrp/AsnC family leucine-responsive transcriptional regulator|uniref:Lrp/AsnC family transcriptional regulator n=1 Tax=Petroclostridium sp. X23 TaxID=3045146 RepID=UPI0024AE0953|nr:Lrp/AsnC family transcriptional regulator [Petroclostridium sp. X23]WHH58860.1 Lrp/AsnC family transcriptional regulator [Petroclostridium sp. X23]